MVSEQAHQWYGKARWQKQRARAAMAFQPIRGIRFIGIPKSASVSR